MAFNMRLAFVRVNKHRAQLYKDSMNRWTVKVKDNPTTFDAAPWVNYQGETYMGQAGDCYVVLTEPDLVDKWGQLIKVNKPKIPPFEDTKMQKLLNTLKVHIIHSDNPSITLYVYKTAKTQNCYFTKNYDPSTIHNEKMMYVFLEGLLSMTTAPLYVDKYGIKYELMERRVAQGLTWQGLPIPELAPGFASSIGAGVISPQRSEIRKPERLEKPALSAPPMPMLHAATFNLDKMGSATNLEPFRPTFQTPTVQIRIPHGDMSAQFPGRQLFNQRRVRPSDFQKWVNKFNGMGDPYDHLAIFKQTTRAEHVTDLHTLVEGFGLTLEGRALTWFQSLNTSKYQSFSALRMDFKAAFSKTGSKNDALSLVYGFKQDPKETVRDCASHLRQYMTRCPTDKLPMQERLVSIFQESLLNRELHAALFMKNHKVLEDCILDAIKYDDNCSKDGTGTRIISSTISTSTPGTQADQIIEGVVEKMQKLCGNFGDVGIWQTAVLVRKRGTFGNEHMMYLAQKVVSASAALYKRHTRWEPLIQLCFVQRAAKALLRSADQIVVFENLLECSIAESSAMTGYLGLAACTRTHILAGYLGCSIIYTCLRSASSVPHVDTMPTRSRQSRSRSSRQSHLSSSSQESTGSKYSSMSKEEFEAEARRQGFERKQRRGSSVSSSSGCFDGCFGRGRKREEPPILETVNEESDSNFEFQPCTQLQFAEPSIAGIADTIPDATEPPSPIAKHPVMIKTPSFTSIKMPPVTPIKMPLEKQAIPLLLLAFSLQHFLPKQ
ncbi:hypothetical protein L7F22_006850 [Adiantum nelumboides]|nr:hypothetical protein [Adiantum nelumboides]